MRKLPALSLALGLVAPLLAATPISGLKAGTPAAKPVVRASTGDDLNRVIARARSAGATAVELADGTYYLDRPITLGPAQSGRPDRAFAIRPARGAQPVLSAGRPLGKLDWQDWRDGIVRARITGPAFDMLRIGDQQLVRARYPNASKDGGLFGGTAADATSSERIARWRNPAGGVIRPLHPSRWGSIDQVILGKNPDGSLRLANPVGNNRMASASADKRYVENILEELDAPGEWYADFDAGWLYLRPPAGIDPQTASFVVSRLENAIILSGTSGAPVHDIAISGITIRDTLQTFGKTTEPLLRSDWMFHRGGAVLIEGAERVTIRDSDLRDIGGNGIVVSGYNRRVSIRDNHIRRAGASAIAFVGRPEAVRSPLFEYRESQPLAAIDRTPGPKGDAYPAESDATGNLIHDIGLNEKQSAGVQIAMAARITVANNSIYRVPRAGINVGDGNWGGHRISGNDVFKTVLETGDHGAFNAWGRDRFWVPQREEMNRRAAADPSLPFLDAIAPTYLTHNRFQCDHGWDIDLDDGASNYVIEENVLLSGGLKLREGFRRIARNNIILNSGLRPHVWFANSGDIVEHNILGTGHGPIGMKFWGTRIDRNLFPSAGALQRAQALGIDRDSIAGDPRFTAPERGDYRPAPGSPAYRIGFRAFRTDQFGVTSPRLRAIAEQPDFPALIDEAALAESKTTSLLGMTVKKVESLDEQSAAGLPDRNALLVIAVEPGSVADRAGVKANDAILAIAAANGNERTPTASLSDLIEGYRNVRWRGQFILSLFHDQAAVERLVRPE